MDGIIVYKDDDLSFIERLKARGKQQAGYAATVREIVSAVKEGGDKALFSYCRKFDGASVTPENILVTRGEIEAAYREVPKKTVAALKKAAGNILRYNLKIKPKDVTTGKAGARAGYVIRPVRRAGIYVPGGTAAYPSTVLMCALPAKAAGVPETVMATPARAAFGFKVNPLTLIAADISGVQKIYKIGGAQAIAALAYGTETVPRADVIAGPGNIYVALAKKEIFGDAGIDSIAGPSEIVVIADKTANPAYVAADLLSQAEHDELATSILLTDDAELIKLVCAELEKQIEKLARKEIARASLRDNGAAVLCRDLDRAVELSNLIAPEHLELCTSYPRGLLPAVINAGAVFLGHYTPEPVGDYFAGPNHVLPTAGSARFFSALSAENYVKKISVIEYDEPHLAGACKSIAAIAGQEGLDAHINAVKVRIENKIEN
ncbi:MAG: histidinol dehydrogenase [Clostridiales bacterium]|jgi:histidinol dehydrogenase|nr:histidinol dehydrogenase [Clostridiales bacterium]